MMKKLIPRVSMFMIACFLFATGLFAQEQTEVTIKVKKEGKVVHDTTYSFDDAESAEHYIQLAEAFSHGDMEHMHSSADKQFMHEVHVESKDGKTVKKIIVIDEDGNREIKEYHGDSLVWISAEHGDIEDMEHLDGHMKEVEKYITVSEEGKGKTKVYVIRTEGDEGMKTFDILEEDDNVKVMKIDDDGEMVTIIESEDGGEKRVEVKVIKTGEGEGEWTVESDEDEDIIIIKKEKEIINDEVAPKETGKNSKKQK